MRITIVSLIIGLAAFCLVAQAGSDPARDLLEAARRGKVDEVRALLSQGVSVNSADKDGYTPLMRATLSAKTDTVEALIQAGADVNLKNNKGQTAAFLAIDNMIGEMQPGILLMMGK